MITVALVGVGYYAAAVACASLENAGQAILIVGNLGCVLYCIYIHSAYRYTIL